MRSDIYEILDYVCQYPGKKVLATIIDVQGSAYKRAGSTMLFHEDGLQVGLLSGGCLEEDVFERVKPFFYEPSSTIITYDLSAEDDLSWGQGAGCNGKIKIVVETVTSQVYKDIQKVRTLVNNGVNIVHIKRFSKSNEITDYLFHTEFGENFGNWNGALPTITNVADNSTLLFDNQGDRLFFQKILARPRLIIYGAGVDAIPLAQLAQYTGLQVIIADWRPAFCNKRHFPFAYKTVIATPNEFVSSFSFTTSDSVVLMTHNYEKDKQLIELLVEKKLGYLGILGSKTRAERLLRGMDIPEWVHFPVGLSIGAEGPQEIAISVIAELIQNKTRRLDMAL